MDYEIEQMITSTEAIVSESSSLIKNISQNKLIIKKIVNISFLITNAIRNGKKVLFFGNGGSAADAQHMAGEFVSRFLFDRDALPAIALTTDSSVLTAIANDYGYQEVFSRQIQALGAQGDIAFAYSTSGNSLNVLEGLLKAKKKGLITIGMTGDKKNKMNENCEIIINIPSDKVPRIQEGHLLLGHTICQLVEMNLFK